MTRYLVATASVHTTAAVCDYLQERVTDADTVVLVSVTEPGMDARDAGDAVNVARTRLVAPLVQTVTREGDPAEVIRDVVSEYEIDEVVIGPRRGDPEATPGLGGTAADLLVSLSVPVVVVPLEDL
jgi:nucleotide-binding universal stress UspA family protein